MSSHEIPAEGGVRWGVTAEELVGLAAKGLARAKAKFLPSTVPYIRYDIETAVTTYGTQPWIQLRSSKHALDLPYTLIHDFRKSDGDDRGTAVISGQFNFPAALLSHGEAMIKQFKAEGRLSEKKGDPLCPRVTACSHDPDGRLRLDVERARYYDQVGSNVTLDHPLAAPIDVGGAQCNTPRLWDRVQACGERIDVPPLNASRLANTARIAVSPRADCRRARH